MVVGHDDVERELTRPGDGLGRRDAAVHGDQQSCATGCEPFDGLDRDAVAVLEATRQEGLDLAAEESQHLDRERGGTDAVDVVVAVHDDRTPGLDRALDQDTGLLDVAQTERVVKRAVAVEESAGDVRVAHSAADEHLGGDALEAQRVGEVAHLIGAAGRDRERRRHPLNLGPGPDAACARSGFRPRDHAPVRAR